MTVTELMEALDDIQFHGFGSLEVEVPETVDKDGFLEGKPVKNVVIDRGTKKVYITVVGGLV